MVTNDIQEAYEIVEARANGQPCVRPCRHIRDILMAYERVPERYLPNDLDINKMTGFFTPEECAKFDHFQEVYDFGFTELMWDMEDAYHRESMRVKR